MSLDQYAVPDSVGLPASDSAERAILGSLLLDSARLVDVVGKLEAADFSLDSHQRVYRGIVEVATTTGRVDSITLMQYLTDQKELLSVGGAAFVMSLTDGLPRFLDVENYVRIVKDKALCRRLLAFSEALTGQAYSQDIPSMEIAAWSVSELARIAEQGEAKTDVFSAADLVDDAEYRQVDNPEPTFSISTTLSALDQMTGRIRLGELWVIGASPSRGKTTLARQIVSGAIKQSIGCYVHSGEMTKESWLDITACLHRNLPTWKMRDKLLNLAEREQLRLGIRELSRMPLYISDAPTVTLEKLIWNATRLKRSKNICLVAVDYAQIIKAHGQNIREQVTNVAFRLRDFAKAENVGVLLLSQSPRPEGRNINARPNMHSLKESGALEEAAHVIVLPYRPVDEASKFTGMDELIVGKNRNGVLDSVHVTLNGQYLRFEER